MSAANIPLTSLVQFKEISKLAFTEQNLQSNICRKSFYDFLKTFWSTIIPEEPQFSWYHEKLCQEYQELTERIVKNLPKKYDLVVNQPPGTTKSTIFSVCGPAWDWTQMPSMKIICGSYAYAVAMDLSRKSRDIITSDLYKELFPEEEMRLRGDQSSKAYYINKAGGMRFSVGTSGSVTGMHAHKIIVDDPIDPRQAASELELRAANQWMTQTLSSRKVNKAVTPTILVMQRLHQEDPTGYKISTTKKSGIRHICLPAELTEGVSPQEFVRYYKKNLLDPVRMGASVLGEIRRELGEYGYAGQFLQTPAPPGGGVFQTGKFRVVDECEGVVFKKLVRYWDKAATANSGCYTVGVKMGLDKQGNIWIIDVLRGQWDSGRRENLIAGTADLDGYSVIVGVEQEPGSGGKESAQATARRLSGFNVRIDRVQGKKEARADPYAASVNNGNVYMVRGPWNRAYIDELANFPHGKYKDQVDASSGGFAILTEKKLKFGAF